MVCTFYTHLWRFTHEWFIYFTAIRNAPSKMVSNGFFYVHVYLEAPKLIISLSFSLYLYPVCQWSYVKALIWYHTLGNKFKFFFLIYQQNYFSLICLVGVQNWMLQDMIWKVAIGKVLVIGRELVNVSDICTYFITSGSHVILQFIDVKIYFPCDKTPLTSFWSCCCTYM